MLVLYLSMTLLSYNWIISLIHKMEMQIAKALSLPPATSPGVLANELWKSDSFRETAAHMIGNNQILDELFLVPPMALVYGFIAMTFIPLLIVLTSSGRISQELASGSARFALVRTTRVTWVLGKFVGQALELIVPLALSALGAFTLASLRLSNIDQMDILGAIVVYTWKAWVYGLAFIGLALGISQMTRSQHLATALSFVALITLGILAIVAGHYAEDGAHSGWYVVKMLVPMGHKSDLWRTNPVRVLHGSVYVVGLAMAYLNLGYVWFSRRDV
jgi:hypothetical protein